MNKFAIHNLINLINHKPLPKFCVVFAKYECGCKGHGRCIFVGKDRRNSKIIVCDGCNNLMMIECVKYDKSICLVCSTNGDKKINLSNCVMCGYCGNVINFNKQKIYCWICHKDYCDCDCSHILCQRCNNILQNRKN